MLNGCFNIVLFADYTVLHDSSLSPLGFIIPTHYLSFVKTVSSRFDFSTDPARIFQFQQPGHLVELREYIERISRGCTQFRVISGLALSKSRSTGLRMRKKRNNR